MPILQYSTSLTSLPTELIILILCALDTPSLHLATLPTPIFGDLWCLHTASISKPILRNTIDCFPSALELESGLDYSTARDGYNGIVTCHNRIYLASQRVATAYKQFLRTSTSGLPFQRVYHASGLGHEEAYNKKISSKRVFYWFCRSMYRGPVDVEELKKDRLMLCLRNLVIWITQRDDFSPVYFTRELHMNYGASLDRGETMKPLDRWMHHAEWLKRRLHQEFVWHLEEYKKTDEYKAKIEHGAYSTGGWRVRGMLVPEAFRQLSSTPSPLVHLLAAIHLDFCLYHNR